MLSALARKQAPLQPEISYNMAQAYFRKLFLPEAGEAMKEAALAVAGRPIHI